jgi:uncharacterized small protein (DUF1192 family)
VHAAHEAELAGIDENLVRHNLSAAEETIAIERIAVLKAAIAQRDAERAAKEAGGIIRQNGEKVARAHRATGNKATGRPPKPASNAKVGAIQGVAATTVRRARKRVEALGEPMVKRVVGTTLDKGVELDALAKMPPTKCAKIGGGRSRHAAPFSKAANQLCDVK